MSFTVICSRCGPTPGKESRWTLLTECSDQTASQPEMRRCRFFCDTYLSLIFPLLRRSFCIYVKKYDHVLSYTFEISVEQYYQYYENCFNTANHNQATKKIMIPIITSNFQISMKYQYLAAVASVSRISGSPWIQQCLEFNLHPFCASKDFVKRKTYAKTWLVVCQCISLCMSGCWYIPILCINSLWGQWQCELAP